MREPRMKQMITLATALMTILAVSACAGGAVERAAPTEPPEPSTVPTSEPEPTATASLSTQVPPTDTSVPVDPTETPTSQPATPPPATTAPKVNAAPAVGAAAPPLVLPDLNGEEVNLMNLRGKPVLLNFWTTW